MSSEALPNQPSAAEAEAKPVEVPKDAVNIRLLLTNGSKADFVCQPQITVEALKRQVLENWPKDWASMQESMKTVETMRLLYRGRFLENSGTLEAQKLPLGETTTMHLLPAASPGAAPTVTKCKCLIQ